MRSRRTSILLLAVVAALAAGAAGAAPALMERRPAHPRLGSALVVVRLVDASRDLRLPHRGPQPRVLMTYVRYPTRDGGQDEDHVGAPPAQADGPFPLVVFAHGFDVTPAVYSRLLQAWTRAGYVVAAPVFPGANADAPGGPDESDIVNQPADVSFVITRLLKADRTPGGILTGLIDPTRVAVAGHSDGAVTALAVAAERGYRDSRVRAAVILSGAWLGAGRPRFAQGSPPLLASFGTADTLNLPRTVLDFYAAARPPKYLLSLLGATHLPPYTTAQPWLGIVERTTIAFLDLYMKGQSAVAQLVARGNVRGRASLRAQP
jgi:dienelactone hydrolase